MIATIKPGGTISGHVRVPGDKSIAHRWLMLAATASGSSRLVEVPTSLDVRSTASCLAMITSGARPALERWARNGRQSAEGHGSTWNVRVEGAASLGAGTVLEVEGDGRDVLVEPGGGLPCGNSGTTMRLLMGLLAPAAFPSVLIGDESLSSRPMERVAAPLRMLGAHIDTDGGGHAPVRIAGQPLHGAEIELDVASAQVKGALLFAGIAAEGRTTVHQVAVTRDHTERAIAALGGPVGVDGVTVWVERFRHGGFEATVPGDPSSAAFLVAAAAITGSELTISELGLNPTRTRFLDVMLRMGIEVERTVVREELGEPVGELHVRPGTELAAIRVDPDELPLVIDEVPVLAALAAHARSDSWFHGAGELALKESNRLEGLAVGLRTLGCHAAVEGEDLVVAGGGLAGGRARAGRDHRMAMAFAVAALGARGAVEVEDIESADVSFPGFLETLRGLGALIEEPRA